jgi:serine/threonine protein kinase
LGTFVIPGPAPTEIIIDPGGFPHHGLGAIEQMSEKIGRFELISQIAQTPFATVHKALDSETQQTVALKVVRLDQVKDRAELLKQIFAEAEQAKPLSSHNIAALYGSGDEGDLLIAAAEYVQGNSVATTLARKDGFSIWDLQDIARQVCQALDHASGHKVVHHSLEPAKIMVQWDGMVKVLGFGMSDLNSLAMESASVPDILHYAAPEKLRGEACDERSMIFSLGAILYEMATEQKAFSGDTAEQLRSAILEQTPPLPVRLKPNVNAGLSDLIMKAIAKSPDERYQSGQDLIRDLEQCKNSANALKSATPPAFAKPKAFAAAAGAAGAGAVSSTASSAIAPKMSVAAPPQEPSSKPSFKIDPMMAEEEDSSPAAKVRKSFSDMSELPPLKEVVIAAATPAAPEADAAETALPEVVLRRLEAEKPKIQVREAAQKAVSEIKKTPPKLYLYAIGGAAALIVIIIAGMALFNWLGDRDSGGPRSQTPAARPAQAPPPQQNPQPQATIPPEPAQPEPAVNEPPQESPAAEAVAPPAALTGGRGKKSRTRSTPAVAPAQLSVSSNPPGAQISFDGSALCDSPCTLTGIAPGQHTVSASKAGFAAVSRTVTLASAANAAVSLELAEEAARLSVASTPAGGVILIDGKDTGKLTPSQFVLERPGTHTVTIRRAGYLDESGSVSTERGQSANLNLALKPLGNTDEIRAAGGKFKKVFGRGGDDANAGIVSVKTQPKGAQIMVNNRVLDKTAPFDFYLNPGTYVIDISLSGYRGVHRVVNVESKERVAIEETLIPQ